MKMKTPSLVLGAAIAGIVGAATVSTPAMAAKKAEMGLCKGANACSGKSACGQAKKDGNSCKGQGYAMMTKAKCEKKKMEWMPAPKMDNMEKKSDEAPKS